MGGSRRVPSRKVNTNWNLNLVTNFEVSINPRHMYFKIMYIFSWFWGYFAFFGKPPISKKSTVFRNGGSIHIYMHAYITFKKWNNRYVHTYIHAYTHIYIHRTSNKKPKAHAYTHIQIWYTYCNIRFLCIDTNIYTLKKKGERLMHTHTLICTSCIYIQSWTLDLSLLDFRW